MKKKFIIQLAKFLKNDVMPNLSLEDRGYASLEEANDFIFKNPLAFTLGLIFDQSIKSSMAWQGPYLLQKRLNHLDVRLIAAMTPEELKNIIATKKALHRYPGTIAKNIIATCKVLVSDFSGDALNLWKNHKSINDVKKNFLTLGGIGEKKANLAILMLARDFLVQFNDIEDLPLAIDVHLKRVLTRSGFFNTESRDGLKELHQDFKKNCNQFPALLGTAIWIIGRNFCHEVSPDCDHCPLTHHCLKRINNG